MNARDNGRPYARCQAPSPALLGSKSNAVDSVAIWVLRLSRDGHIRSSSLLTGGSDRRSAYEYSQTRSTMKVIDTHIHLTCRTGDGGPGLANSWLGEFRLQELHPDPPAATHCQPPIQITASLPYKSLPASHTTHCHSPIPITASLSYKSLPASHTTHCRALTRLTRMDSLCPVLVSWLGEPRITL